jgi:hypothetical protein
MQTPQLEPVNPGCGRISDSLKRNSPTRANVAARKTLFQIGAAFNREQVIPEAVEADVVG